MSERVDTPEAFLALRLKVRELEAHNTRQATEVESLARNLGRALHERNVSIAENTRLQEKLAAVEPILDALSDGDLTGLRAEMLGREGNDTGRDTQRWARRVRAAIEKLQRRRATSDKSALRQPDDVETETPAWGPSPVVKLVCGCGHTVETLARLMRELRASGGDGPYCIECHKAGRPDSLMAVKP